MSCELNCGWLCPRLAGGAAAVKLGKQKKRGKPIIFFLLVYLLLHHTRKRNGTEYILFCTNQLRGIIKKKTGKKRSGWPLGLTPPPLSRSGQENVKISRQVVIFGVILPFYNGQNGPKFSQNKSGQAGGRWPPLPPPKRSAWPLFSRFFFDDSP